MRPSTASLTARRDPVWLCAAAGLLLAALALPAAAEALGCTVTWDGESKRMDILTPVQRGEADL